MVVSFVPEQEAHRGSRVETRTLICKFVLIRRADCLHFVVGPVADFRYHADLVERFCNHESIPATWVQRPDVMEVLDSEVQMKGGGVLEINYGNHTMELSGMSKAYGGFQAGDLADFVKTDPFFAGYRVTVSPV